MRTLYCGELRAEHVDQNGDAVRLGAPPARSRRRDFHRPARSGRPRANRLQPRAPGGVPRRRARARRVRAQGDRQGAPPAGGHGEPRAADRRSRSRGAGSGNPQRLGHAAVSNRRRQSRGGNASRVPRARSAARTHAAQSAPAAPGRHGDAAFPRSARLHRHRNAGALQVNPGRRARVPGAFASARRPFLRAAAIAAALQADADGGRLRPLLPDRQVLPRRGPASRPATRIHPDRYRDLVPVGARHPQADGGAGALRVPRGRRHRAAGAVPGAHLRRSDARLRQRQARPAGAAQARRAHRRGQGRRLQGVLRSGECAGRPRMWTARARRRFAHPRRARCLRRVRKGAGREGAGLDQGQPAREGRRRLAIADREEPPRARAERYSGPDRQRRTGT